MSEPRPWEVGDERSRWDGYLAAPGILRVIGPDQPATAAMLRAFENNRVADRELEQRMNPIRGSFDFAHLAAIHRVNFSSVYEWAGEARTVGIRKAPWMHRPDGSKREPLHFERFDKVRELVDAIPAYLAATNMLRGRTPNEFADGVAVVYAQTNLAHPFREGNGRTQRIFLDAIAEQAGHRIDWSRVDPDINDVASYIAIEHDDVTPLQEVMRQVVIGAQPRVQPLTDAGLEKATAASLEARQAARIAAADRAPSTPARGPQAPVHAQTDPTVQRERTGAGYGR